LVPYSGNRALVEGAFFAAITVVLGFLGQFVPLLPLLMPVPLAVLVRRHDLKLGFMALAVAVALMFMLFGRPLTVLLLVIQSGPVGLLLGLLFKNRVSSGLGIAVTSIMGVVTTVLVLAISFWLTGISPFAMGDEMHRSIEQALKFYQRNGLLDNAQLQMMKASMEQAINFVVQLIPGILVTASIMSSFITYALTHFILVKMQFETVPLPPFSRWKLPWYVIWGGIAGLSFILLGDEIALASLATVGKNILYVMGFVYFILGVSVFIFFMKKWNIARPVKFLIVALVVLYWHVALSMMLTLGVIDPVMDLRRLSKHGDTTKGG